MTQRDLLTDVQAARALNCPVQDLPAQAERGQVEEVTVHNNRFYRIVPPSRGAQENPSHPRITVEKPSRKQDREKFFQPSDGPVLSDDVPTGEINVALLLEQNKDRARLIDQMTHQHRLRVGLLEKDVERLSWHRLGLIIVLEIAVGAAIIVGTLTHDRLVRTRSAAADYRRMAVYHEQAHQTAQASYDELHTAAAAQQAQLRQANLANARLRAQIDLQEVKMTEARQTISRLLRENTLSRK